MHLLSRLLMHQLALTLKETAQSYGVVNSKHMLASCKSLLKMTIEL